MRKRTAPAVSTAEEKEVVSTTDLLDEKDVRVARGAPFEKIVTLTVPPFAKPTGPVLPRGSIWWHIDVVTEPERGKSLLDQFNVVVVLASDVYHRVRIEAAGLDTSSEALALDVIKAVGPRGHFMRQRHTRDQMRRRVFSGLTGQPDGTGGLRDPIDVARDKVDWILNNHHPRPLERAQQAELSRILAAADRDI